jgi:hypothetical protein
MVDGAGSSKLWRKAPILQHVCTLVLLLSAFSPALAIPLPRPRPADIPGDQPSPCQQRLAEFAQFKTVPPISGPGECSANDVIALESVKLPNQHQIFLSPPATLRCPMGETVALWLRDDVAPAVASFGGVLRGVETLDSFVCRGRNGATGGKLSEHGRANALDVRSFRLTNGRTIALTDETIWKPLRERLRQSACARFTTVLGNGADAFHESHVHLDLLQRSNNYRICQWDVLNVAEGAALAAKKAAVASSAIPERDVPLPRPRPATGNLSSLSHHPGEHVREVMHGTVFDLIMPFTRHTR